VLTDELWNAASVDGDASPALRLTAPRVVVVQVLQFRQHGFSALNGFAQLLDLSCEGVGVGL
jgi:hypothetical protein